MNFNDLLIEKANNAETILNKYLPEESGFGCDVMKSMNYSILTGGKRIRPVLMNESFLLFGGKGSIVEPFMAALEMIHNYSLVHDDLPAMDNDEYRRGRKTTWKVFGDGMAVLAGDGLLNLAFETAMKSFDMTQDETATRQVISALKVLAEKAGIYGMIGGQAADIEAEQSSQVTEELLLFIHEHKTAALIQAALMIGAILAGASQQEVSMMEKAAYDIGVAFQIQDDILDVTGTAEVLGKPIGSDAKNNKLTYVAFHGLEASTDEVERLSQEALDILNSFDNKNEFLLELVTSLITRKK